MFVHAYVGECMHKNVLVFTVRYIFRATAFTFVPNYKVTTYTRDVLFQKKFPPIAQTNICQ